MSTYKRRMYNGTNEHLPCSKLKAKCHINTQPDTQIQTQEDSYTQKEIEFFDISNIKPDEAKQLTGETIPPGVKNKLGFTVRVVQFKSCLFVWMLCFLFRLLSRA